MKIPKLTKNDIMILIYVLFGCWLIACLITIEDNIFRLSVGVSTVFWLITSTEYSNNRRHMKDEQ